MAIANPHTQQVRRNTNLANHERTANKQMADVSAKAAGGLDRILASTPVKSVGSKPLPKVNGIDLEEEARKSYIKKYDIVILNDNFAKKGYYYKSDFTKLTKSELEARFNKLLNEAESIQKNYSEMQDLSANQMMTLRHLTWLRSLRSEYDKQSKIANKQDQIQLKMKAGGGDSEDTYLTGNTREYYTGKKIPIRTPGISDKGRERNIALDAYRNAASQQYDSIDHSNPWRTNTDVTNMTAHGISKIAKFFKPTNKTSLSKEEANAKKHLKEARHILVTSNAVNDDNKFKISGEFDKYTTNAIVKIAEGKDLHNIKKLFPDKELDYIKDVISKMKPDYTWEFTVEDVYMDGELFSECESSLVNVESDELVEESAIEELQQLADLL